MTRTVIALPTLPASRAVRRLARRDLGAAGRALRRLELRASPEALHDFRVALRRLRGLLRAYGAVDGVGVPKKLRRRVRRLAAFTNAARDAEVQEAWIDGHDSALAAGERAGARWLRQRLAAQREREYARLGGELPGAFARLERKLRKRLSAPPRRRAAPEAPVSFAAAAARALAAEATALDRGIAALRRVRNAETAHAVRIHSKRLRYLLEPLAPHLPEGPELVAQLKLLQDLLGEFNECQLLAGEIASGIETLAAEQARQRFRTLLAGQSPPRRRSAEERGLVALARVCRARADEVFARLEGDWLGKRAFALLQPLRERLGTVSTDSGSPSPRYRPTRRRVAYPTGSTVVTQP